MKKKYATLLSFFIGLSFAAMAQNTGKMDKFIKDPARNANAEKADHHLHKKTEKTIIADSAAMSRTAAEKKKKPPVKKKNCN
jgi:hypothetical protein